MRTGNSYGRIEHKQSLKVSSLVLLSKGICFSYMLYSFVSAKRYLRSIFVQVSDCLCRCKSMPVSVSKGGKTLWLWLSTNRYSSALFLYILLLLMLEQRATNNWDMYYCTPICGISMASCFLYFSAQIVDDRRKPRYFWNLLHMEGIGYQRGGGVCTSLHWLAQFFLMYVDKSSIKLQYIFVW